MTEREEDITEMRHFSLWRYLAATLVPTLLLLFSLSIVANHLDEQVDFTKDEIHGVEAMDLLRRSQWLLQSVCGLMQISAWQGVKPSSEVQLLQTEFISVFDAPQWQHAEQRFGLKTPVDALLTDARRQFLVNLQGPVPEQLLGAHCALMHQLEQIMRLTADRSHLTLDPVLETYYLIDLFRSQLSHLTSAIARVRGIGLELLVKKHDATKAEIVSRQIAAITFTLDDVRYAKSVISSVDPRLAGVLKQLPKATDPTLKAFLTVANDLLRGRSPNIGIDRFYQLCNSAIAAYEPVTLELERLVSERIRTRLGMQRSARNLAIAGTALAISAIVYFITSFYRHIRRAYREIVQLSITDPLTRLPNRRFLYSVFPIEMRRARREGKSFSFAILDIDYFKRYNDTYGHQAGDDVLVKLSEVLATNLSRASDFIFRFGGEEFCFFFIGESSDNALEIAEHVRQAVEELQIPHGGNEVSRFVTISLGMTNLDIVRHEELSTLTRQADAALYAAKNAGRNRCETYRQDADVLQGEA